MHNIVELTDYGGLNSKHHPPIVELIDHGSRNPNHHPPTVELIDHISKVVTKKSTDEAHSARIERLRRFKSTE